MQKHILVAIDNTVHSMDALHYTATLSTIIPETRYSLIHIQPVVSQYLTDEARLKANARKALENVGQAHQAKGLEILETAARRLMQKGVPEDHIEQITTPRRDTSVASDILATSIGQIL